ncbi:MAG: hypothetical protein EBS06_05410 [Proteobacteria bacterium]|nr:hypothetical protein [Pseudomonadota bacterium]
MTQQTNSFDSFEAIGNREQLADKIWDVSITETPMLNAIPSGETKGTHPEWQTDALASASGSNAQLEGNIYSLSTTSPTTRVGTYTQISTKTFSITGTQEVVEKAGRASEVAYQQIKKTKELKRDIETRICGNYASVAGDASTARQTAGLQAWLTTNVSRGTSGANGGFSSGIVSAATNGTQRTFTETLLKTVLQLAWASTGEVPDMALMSGTQKQTAAGFAGNATRYKDADARSIMAGADIYESDFGQVMLVPSIFTDSRSCLLVNKDYVEIDYLTGRKLVTDKMAKVADSEDYAINTEFALICKNQLAHGVVADLS